MRARGGMIAPTRPRSTTSAAANARRRRLDAAARWRELYSDADAVFDKNTASTPPTSSR
ncbi:MAG: hypothetical protein ACLU5I_02210 [Alistipes finegoldii]